MAQFAYHEKEECREVSHLAVGEEGTLQRDLKNWYCLGEAYRGKGGLANGKT